MFITTWFTYSNLGSENAMLNLELEFGLEVIQPLDIRPDLDVLQNGIGRVEGLHQSEPVMITLLHSD